MRRINDINKVKPRVGHTIIGKVYGKVRTPALNNQHYCAVFIDKGGNLSQVCLMTFKDETLSKFKKYLTWKRSINDEVRKLKYDGGRQMINNTSKKWIRDNCIYLCEGAPYKDDHTALINPEIRHTMNLTRAMMIYAKRRALDDRHLHPWAASANKYKEGINDDLDKLYDRISMIIQTGVYYIDNTIVMTESHKALLSGPEGRHWKQADEEVFASFRSEQVFELVRRPEGGDEHGRGSGGGESVRTMIVAGQGPLLYFCVHTGRGHGGAQRGGRQGPSCW